MKANASEPLMTSRNQVRRRQNRDFKRGPGSSVGGDLFATDTTSGFKAARAWIGLRYGTLEPVASMQREKAQADTPRGRKYRTTSVALVCEAQGRNDP